MIMKKTIAIIQTGQPIKSIYAKYGDFDQWINQSMQVDLHETNTFHIYNNTVFPDPNELLGIVISGSPAMVTEKCSWSEACKDWLRPILSMNIPILGICYGHQLLADLLGGKVNWNPLGREIGQVKLKFEPKAKQDILFEKFNLSNINNNNYYATHQQSVIKLPPQATLLAKTDLDPYHCFRYKSHIWGLQFHPEFSANIIKEYIKVRASEISQEGLDPVQLLNQVIENNNGTQLLTRFKEICFMPSKKG